MHGLTVFSLKCHNTNTCDIIKTSFNIPVDQCLTIVAANSDMATLMDLEKTDNTLRIMSEHSNLAYG